MRLRTQKRGWKYGAAGFLALACFLSMVLWGPATTQGKTVRLLGQVAEQGEYPWTMGLTVRELVNDGGGLGPFARKKVRVLDATPALHVTVGHDAHKLLARLANSVDEELASAWESCHLPGEAPDLSMVTPRPPVKAVVDFRKPTDDFALSPGDVVVVEEVVLNF
jgi:hypothetical protein